MAVASTLGGGGDETPLELKEAVDDLRCCNISKDILVLASVNDWVSWTFVGRMVSFLVINDLVMVVEVGKSDFLGGLWREGLSEREVRLVCCVGLNGIY